MRRSRADKKSAKAGAEAFVASGIKFVEEFGNIKTLKGANPANRDGLEATLRWIAGISKENAEIVKLRTWRLSGWVQIALWKFLEQEGVSLDADGQARIAHFKLD
jgi:hypothetical protein